MSIGSIVKSTNLGEITLVTGRQRRTATLVHEAEPRHSSLVISITGRKNPIRLGMRLEDMETIVTNIKSDLLRARLAAPHIEDEEE
jgi:hypothetical protein